MNELEGTEDLDEKRKVMWREAMIMKFDNKSNKEIAKTLGVEEMTVSRWFTGQIKGFTEEGLQTSMRYMVNYMPLCAKAIKMGLEYASKYEDMFMKKGRLTAKKLAGFRVAISLSSERAKDIMELLSKVILKMNPDINVFGSPGSTINIGKNQVVVNSLDDAKKELDILQRRIGNKEEAIDIEVKK